MYKVFIEDKILIFSEAPCGGADTLTADVSDADNVSLAKLLQKLQFTKCLNIISADPEKVFGNFLLSAPLIGAGGGLVTNPKGEVLMILRNGRWDLPKGKLECGEDIRDCAVREVTEECSVSGIELKEFITNTFHCYRINGQWVIKQTWWYRMFSPGNQVPVPQEAEGIMKAEWVKGEKLPGRLMKTYPNIREVFRGAGYENLINYK